MRHTEHSLSNARYTSLRTCHRTTASRSARPARSRSRWPLLCLLVGLCVFVYGCGDDGGGASNDTMDDTSMVDTTTPQDINDFDTADDVRDQNQNIGLFAPEVTEVFLEIDYQPGAEPATMAQIGMVDSPWRLFETNAEALFEDAPRTLTFPTTLDGMEELGDVSGEEFTVQQILDIADQHWDDRGTATRRGFYVIFLDGYFADGEGRQEQVLGVSIGNTGVIAMFKPVYEGQLVANFIEQTTLIHEFGHAIGLVNRGIAMVEDHHDEEHGAHCTNTNCVMYWLNEGVGDMAEFVRKRVTTGSEIVFGDMCLADTSAAATAAGN